MVDDERPRRERRAAPYAGKMHSGLPLDRETDLRAWIGEELARDEAGDRAGTEQG